MAHSVRLTIGGIVLTVEGGESVNLLMQLPGMSLFASNDFAKPEVRVLLDVPLAEPECRWLHSHPLQVLTERCRFGIDTEGVYHYDFGGMSRLRFDPKVPDEVRISPLTDPMLLRYVLWVAYAMVGLWRGVLPIHSSVVVCGKGAVLCLGESGTGKSTHTALWIKHIEGTYLLNDDSPVVRCDSDGVWAYGSPWSGKSPCFRTEQQPVAAFLRLEQRKSNSIRRLGSVEALTALLPSCPPPLAHDEATMDRVVDYVGLAVSHVPVYRMGCLPDADAARLSYQTIMQS